MGCHNGWSFWQNNLLTRNKCVCAELFKNLLKRWVSFIICRTCCKLNSQYSSAESWSRRSKCVIWDQSPPFFFVLFTYRQVTKSNCINLIDFGRNVKVLTTTKSLLYQHTVLFLLIITECILSYWIRADFIVIPEGHSGIVVWQP